VQQPFCHQKVTLIACGVNGQAELIRKPPWKREDCHSAMMKDKD
jgi:hypothetical protein